ncbi:hypothetical protein Asi02nite_76340 [Asanoa siamensis]|uniref:Uncharacterized protein n=2 Tax=Asanoa siamensis TaxID=926357 RepID=A0ABQ4D3K5_9ACTN|nr:hypothetical protein Asi02nite_76340 [Asanoa siamensis]
MVGSLLPYNPVDRPLSASRPALTNPWQTVDIARQLAEEHAASGRALRLGHDFGRIEVAVTEVYAALTVAYGPVVRPSVHEIYTRVGCRERRAQYALRALQRAGLLYQHADGCMVRDENGDMQRLAAEYELRVPLAYLERAQVMDELDETVDRDRLDLYLDAAANARALLSGFAEEAPATGAPLVDQAQEVRLNAPVDNPCTPFLGLLSMKRSGSSSPTECPQKRNFPRENLYERELSPLPLEHPRTRRGYALARKLVERAPRWRAVPLPSLAAALEPLAARSWTAFQVDRAAETYGQVSSSSGLYRVLQAVVAFVIGDDHRRQGRVSRMTVRIVEAALAAEHGPPVWSDTSTAAQTAYGIAAEARARSRQRKTSPAGWDRLIELTDPEAAVAAARSARIHARARHRAASERARRSDGHC